MATPTYVPLATITLASDDNSITFSSIPATYRDLILVSNAKRSTAASIAVYIRFNSDTGSNYSFVEMRGDGSSASSVSSTISDLYAGWCDGNDFRGQVCQIMDYSATDKQTTALTRMQRTDRTSAMASRWANTSAIHTISIRPSGGSFAIGSTFSLYGVN